MTTFGGSCSGSHKFTPSPLPVHHRTTTYRRSYPCPAGRVQCNLIIPYFICPSFCAFFRSLSGFSFPTLGTAAAARAAGRRPRTTNECHSPRCGTLPVFIFHFRKRFSRTNSNSSGCFSVCPALLNALASSLGRGGFAWTLGVEFDKLSFPGTECTGAGCRQDFCHASSQRLENKCYKYLGGKEGTEYCASGRDHFGEWSA